MRLLDFGIFQSRAEVSDGYGNTNADWAKQFESRVSVRYLRGSEAVMAARLEGRQPVIVTVRNSDQVQEVTPGWRVLVNGVAYNIREPLRPTDQRRRNLEFLAESGVASG